MNKSNSNTQSYLISLLSTVDEVMGADPAILLNLSEFVGGGRTGGLPLDVVAYLHLT